MLNRLLMNSVAAVGLVSALGVASASSDVVVVQDDFGYADNDALREVWLRADVTAPDSAWPEVTTAFTAVPSGQAATLPSGALKLNNGVIYRELDEAITDDFTLSFKALHTNYSRQVAVGMVNEAGTEGYLVYWSSSDAHAFGGNGFVAIRKLDRDTPWDTFAHTGVNLTGTANSGHPATGFTPTNAQGTEFDDEFVGFADVALSWEQATGTVRLSVNGVELHTLTDTDFSTFSRVYIRGNTHSYVDDLAVTVVPEPGSLGLLGMGVLMIIRRQRQN